MFKLVLFLIVLLSAANGSFAQQFDEILDGRDSTSYEIVKIGNSWWMAENLAYLPKVYPLFTNRGFYVYNYYGYDVDSAKASKEYERYGSLYSWESAIEACPQGWHLPSDLDWINLEKHLGMSDFELDSLNWRRTGGIDKELMSHDGWENITSNNKSGFSALPGGISFSKPYLRDTIFALIGESANFWTSTKETEDKAFARGLYIKTSGVGRAAKKTSYGLSVRCIKN